MFNVKHWGYLFYNVISLINVGSSLINESWIIFAFLFIERMITMVWMADSNEQKPLLQH